MSEEPSPSPRRRVLTARQITALAEGRAQREAQRVAAPPIDLGLVPTSSAEIRARQQERAVETPPPEPPPLEDGPRGRFLDSEPAPPPEPEAPPPEPVAPRRGKKRSRLTMDELLARHTEVPPPIEQVARETQHYTVGVDPIPMSEENPYLASGVTARSAPVEDHGAATPNNLADLMSICPTIGDGQYWIEVVRRSPTQYGGVHCKGTQRPIRQQMTDRDFVDFYGGGDYSLTLYGPPPRGGTVDPRTGRPLHKALTKPVKLEISPAVYPPNLQSAVLHDDEHGIEGQDMRSYTSPTFSSGFRPNTPADARVLEVSLDHDRKMREADEKRERELRDEAARGNAAVGPLIEVVRKASEDAVRVVERQSTEARRLSEERATKAEREAARERERADQALRAAEARAERERSRPTEAHQMVESMATLIQAVRPADEGSKGALDLARQELTRAAEKHGQELHRLSTEHRAEMDRRAEQYRVETERVERQHREEMKRQEERLKESLDRAERRAEDAERKAEQRIVDAEARVERRLQESRDEHRRLLDEARAAAQTRLDDERRQADRDKQMQEATFQTRLAGQKDMFENRMSSTQQEITRLQAEVDRWRKEADDNKDLSKHLERAQEAAAALGWAPQTQEADEGPKDWKSMFGRLAMEIVQKAPEIVQSAGDTVARLRAQAQPPEQVQAAQHAAMLAQAQQSLPRQMAAQPGALPPLRGRGGQPFHSAPMLRFGTEDAGFASFAGPLPRPVPDPYQPQAVAPIAPEAAPPPPVPYPTDTYAAPMYAPQETYAPQLAPVSAAPPQPVQGTYAPMAASVPPPAPAPTPAPLAAVAALAITPDMILQYAAPLEVAYESGESAANVATVIIGQLGAAQVRTVITATTPARVVVELQKAGRASSPLVRRAGQQFLRDLWAAAAEQLGIQS